MAIDNGWFIYAVLYWVQVEKNKFFLCIKQPLGLKVAVTIGGLGLIGLEL
ncbi:hypothetical protein [Anabaena sp. UHCC 0451]|nr:hypothetical protein [Anabaena sp. UHCC 0451]MEA5579344.1 hypothetical protein [Anabaena sp. UHCC 0451]